MTHQSWPPPKVDHQKVIARYQEVHNLAQVGREYGLSRERVRQIVNRAGISSARIVKPKPARPVRTCKQCGAQFTNSYALYCEVHRTPRERNRRRYERVKADPVRYAHFLELTKKSAQRRRERAHRVAQS
jgi:hypothetical protein